MSCGSRSVEIFSHDDLNADLFLRLVYFEVIAFGPENAQGTARKMPDILHDDRIHLAINERLSGDRCQIMRNDDKTHFTRMLTQGIQHGRVPRPHGIDRLEFGVL